MSFSDSFNPSMGLGEEHPLSVFFDLKMGNLNKIYRQSPFGADGPQFPVDCTILQKSGDQMSEFSVTIFDDTGRDVEDAILTLTDNGPLNSPILMRWGYTTNGSPTYSTPYFTGILTNMETTISNNAFSVVITGTLSKSVATYQTTSAMKTAPPKKVIADYCSRYGFEPPVYSPEPKSEKILRMNETSSETTKSEANVHRHCDKTDYAFLKDATKLLVSGEGKAGYTMFERITKDGKHELHLRLQDSLEFYRTYKVQDKLSDVIEWSPTLSLALSGIKGVSESVHASTQSVTGNQVIHVNSTVATPNKYASVSGTENTTAITTPIGDNVKKEKQVQQFDDSTQGRIFQHFQIDGTSDEATLTMANALYGARQSSAKTAQLTVLGDPFLQQGYKIKVLFNYPSSLRPSAPSPSPHYSSGEWFITQVSHSISGGGYISTLSLERTGNYK